MSSRCNIPYWYPKLFKQYKPLLVQQEALYLALSAGVDSNLLLHWLAYYKDELPPITTIHVNHNWHGKDAIIWAEFAKERATVYGFPHLHYDIYFEQHEPRGWEAAGREERYRLFGASMKEERSLLLTAHHRSDQAETFFQRLLRRSGVRGLGAMRHQTTLTFTPYTINLFRPLLSISKRELYRAATALNIPWMEDYTNHEVDQLSRNIIRNDLFPRIAKHFPYYEEAIYQSTLHLQESYQLLTEVAKEDLAKIAKSTTQEATPSLSRSSLRKLSLPRQKNLLQYWLAQYNLLLTQEQIGEFFRTFIEEEPPHTTRFSIGEYELRYYRDYIYLLPANLPQYPQLQWLPVAEGGHGLTKTQIKQLNLRLIPRKAGSRFHPFGRRHSQSIKKLLQEADLPHWERERCYFLINQKATAHIPKDTILWVNHLGFDQQINTLSYEPDTPLYQPVLTWKEHL